MHFRLKRTGSDAFLLKKKQLEWLAELKPGGFFVLKENLARSDGKSTGDMDGYVGFQAVLRRS
ncbi:hypothetical protein HanXRQr2_Chr03g0105581 [Helianthus annuus]|uniref:Uncharacterized protein n=1 Tax=Helianthus annuus TaxID=4232 RepID=A0A251V7B1_HELAN|nr:hypothetical protein HanXRQr2_Chr03g0105581 [Helianthus annuus]KAJ0592683.1 hypothetical protein HanHA300_Chr03g0088001 [Helianthus annuus]KAJ0600315.1 hypothetical protein HanIR_Chr03g0115191 [Helianthus annuus]KAJ0607682.1 hypothetical protein HanHA89_Chr03g0099591 [Helianthus annuus]KAJ0767747.1 hypothetical protein HanLR1_Chr03g0092971 [Helianthus annuus]